MEDEGENANEEEGVGEETDVVILDFYFSKEVEEKRKAEFSCLFKGDWRKDSLNIARFLARIFLRSKLRI